MAVYLLVIMDLQRIMEKPTQKMFYFIPLIVVVINI